MKLAILLLLLVAFTYGHSQHPDAKLDEDLLAYALGTFAFAILYLLCLPPPEEILEFATAIAIGVWLLFYTVPSLFRLDTVPYDTV